MVTLDMERVREALELPDDCWAELHLTESEILTSSTTMHRTQIVVCGETRSEMLERAFAASAAVDRGSLEQGPPGGGSRAWKRHVFVTFPTGTDVERVRLGYAFGGSAAAYRVAKAGGSAALIAAAMGCSPP